MLTRAGAKRARLAPPSLLDHLVKNGTYNYNNAFRIYRLDSFDIVDRQSEIPFMKEYYINLHFPHDVLLLQCMPGIIALCAVLDKLAPTSEYTILCSVFDGKTTQHLISLWSKEGKHGCYMSLYPTEPMNSLQWKVIEMLGTYDKDDNRMEFDEFNMFGRLGVEPPKHRPTARVHAQSISIHGRMNVSSIYKILSRRFMFIKSLKLADNSEGTKTEENTIPDPPPLCRGIVVAEGHQLPSLRTLEFENVTFNWTQESLMIYNRRQYANFILHYDDSINQQCRQEQAARFMKCLSNHYRGLCPVIVIVVRHSAQALQVAVISLYMRLAIKYGIPEIRISTKRGSLRTSPGDLGSEATWFLRKPVTKYQEVARALMFKSKTSPSRAIPKETFRQLMIKYIGQPQMRYSSTGNQRTNFYGGRASIPDTYPEYELPTI